MLDSPAHRPDASASASGGWHRAALLVAVLLVARIVYLWLFNSWELVADEAHYWEWSRRPDWSYYTKGPGVAWAIWLSTHLFGDSEAAVRTPSAIASALMMLAGSRLAFEISGRGAAAALNAVIALALAPAYFAMAQLLTTDVFWSAGWVIATWLVFDAVRPAATPGRRVASWTSAGFTLGLTCLFKYTALFFIPGVVLFLVLRRRSLRWDRTTWLGIAGSISAMLLAASPIMVWNASRGWPTISHQVGRVRLPGGDESVDWGWSPAWFLSFAGAQLALLGVVGAILIVMAIVRERRRQRAAGTADDARCIGISLLLCVSLPLVLFYLALSAVRQAQGNWAVAGYSTLLVLVGIVVTDALAEHREIVRAWLALPEPRPRAGRLKRRPETPMQVLWHWHIGVGLVVGLIIAAGPSLLKLGPLQRVEVIRKANGRISGARVRAAEIAASMDAHRSPDGRPPLLITSRYQEASLLAYYLPGRPIVYCAASRLGSRKNAYDFFADTNLDAPELRGRPALLIGGDAETWTHALKLDSAPAAADVRGVLILDGFAGFAEDAGR